MEPITIIVGVAALIIGGSSTAVALKWEDIIIRLKGKKIGVLGERWIGKTTLLTYISKGVFINTYKATLATQEVEKRSFKLSELDIKIRKTQDVSGADDVGGYNEWKKLFISSDIIFYIVRADKLLDENPDTEKRVIKDLQNIKSWAEESNKKRFIFIIGNVWEPHEIYSEIRDDKEYVSFLERFQNLGSVAQMEQLVRTETNVVRVVLGSLANQESANKLITQIFTEVINNG